MPAGDVVAKPAEMPWDVAGGLSGAGQAAHTAVEALDIREGDTLLVHAAAGGVGTVAVQIARHRGATVIGAAAGEANHAYLREFGALPVTYGAGLVERVRALAPQGVDAALDAAGEDGLRASVELVKGKNRIGTITSPALCKELGVRWLGSRRSAARLAGLVSLYVQGGLHMHVRSTYAPVEAARAYKDVESGHGRGKVVLLVD